MNLYSYVNDPLTWTDELGLKRGCWQDKFRKRSKSSVKRMRKSFTKKGGARERYLKNLAKDPNAEKIYGKKAVEQMKQGKVPDGYNVHHKKPLFRGGDNSMGNLDLMDEQTHRINSDALHYYPEGQNPYGLN